MNTLSSRMNITTGNARPGDLVDLCLVVEYGGIGAAARAVGRPKSSLSLAIRRLEESLSVRLVDRTKRRFQLTERGRVLYERIHPLLAQLRHATSDFQASSGQVTGSLRIAAPYEFGAHHLARIVKNLIRHNPQLVITLDVQYAPVRELFVGGYDVVFVMADGSLADSDLVSCRVFMLERGLFASPTFLQHHPPLRTPDDLARVPLVASSQDVRWCFTDARERSVDVPIPDRCMRSTNADVRRRAALDGLGVTRTVASFCTEAVSAGKLARVLPAFRCTPLHVYGVVNERRLMPAAVKALFDELEAVSPDLFIETHASA